MRLYRKLELTRGDGTFAHSPIAATRPPMPSFPINPPKRLFSRVEVLQRPSPVPAASGLYAWYFHEIPRGVPTKDCLKFNGNTLLYLGMRQTKQISRRAALPC